MQIFFCLFIEWNIFDLQRVWNNIWSHTELKDSIGLSLSQWLSYVGFWKGKLQVVLFVGNPLC